VPFSSLLFGRLGREPSAEAIIFFILFILHFLLSSSAVPQFPHAPVYSLGCA